MDEVLEGLLLSQKCQCPNPTWDEHICILVIAFDLFFELNPNYFETLNHGSGKQ